jgi:hypothetical protein
MASEQTVAEWAVEEFGQAQLGNALRTRRLVSMAAGVAGAPHGLVTAVFTTVAERVAAYRFLENDRISLKVVLGSCAQAAIQRAVGAAWFYVPVDGSSLALADPSGRRRLGAVGSYERGGRGLKTMTSIAVHEDGTPLGLLDLQWWVRQVVPGRKRTRDRRTVEDKETRYWLQAIQRVEAVVAQSGTAAHPWFQLDREGDFQDLLRLMSQMTASRVTVRAAQDRRTATGATGHLWDTLRAQAPSGVYRLAVAPGPKRQARQARMVVRWAQVSLLLRQRRSGGARRTPVTVRAVLALEEGTVPPGEKPLQWLLLTNASVSSFHGAVEVLFGYAQRWRIEDFHRAWKSQCGVECTQLHDVPHVQLWATLLAAVAMRIERVKHLARNQPDTPASVEFTQDEIDAVIVLRQPPGYRRGDEPTIGLLVRWIADLGGYIGPSNGPPGSTVIGRGLHRVEPVALALQHLAREKPD